jgi:hypothetical protein
MILSYFINMCSTHVYLMYLLRVSVPHVTPSLLRIQGYLFQYLMLYMR